MQTVIFLECLLCNCGAQTGTYKVLQMSNKVKREMYGFIQS